MIESISAHPNFSAGSLTIDLISAGTDDISSDSNVSVSAIFNFAVTSASYTNITVTYVSGTIYTSDVQVQSDDQYMSLNSNSSYLITPNLTWSPSGSISITYSIGNYNSIAAPSWVSINSSTGELTILTPSLTSDTEFDFYFVSTVSGVADPIQKAIKLTVLNWLAQNSKVWAWNEDNSKWWGDGSVESVYGEQWDDGNLISGDGWSSTWQIEAGYKWELFADRSNVSYWTKICGNGIIDNGEQCDDGNSADGDGWSANCLVDSRYTWDIINSPSFWYPTWGNGKRDLNPNVEQWDDGNNMDLDGCSSNWVIEDNYAWSNSTGIDVWKLYIQLLQ